MVNAVQVIIAYQGPIQLNQIHIPIQELDLLVLKGIIVFQEHSFLLHVLKVNLELLQEANQLVIVHIAKLAIIASLIIQFHSVVQQELIVQQVRVRLYIAKVVIILHQLKHLVKVFVQNVLLVIFAIDQALVVI